jgi:hypothetical protein
MPMLLLLIRDFFFCIHFVCVCVYRKTRKYDKRIDEINERVSISIKKKILSCAVQHIELQGERTTAILNNSSNVSSSSFGNYRMKSKMESFHLLLFRVV